jgi:hypothetical protein
MAHRAVDYMTTLKTLALHISADTEYTELLIIAGGRTQCSQVPDSAELTAHGRRSSIATSPPKTATATTVAASCNSHNITSDSEKYLF